MPSPSPSSPSPSPSPLLASDLATGLIGLCGPPVLAASAWREQQQRLLRAQQQRRRRQMRLIAAPPPPVSVTNAAIAAASAAATAATADPDWVVGTPVALVPEDDVDDDDASDDDARTTTGPVVVRMAQMMRDYTPLDDGLKCEIELQEAQRALAPHIPGSGVVGQLVGTLVTRMLPSLQVLLASATGALSTSSTSSASSVPPHAPGDSLGGLLFAPDVAETTTDLADPTDYGIPSIILEGQPDGAKVALTVDMASQLRERLPARQRLLPSWELVFNSSVHGSSMQTIMDKLQAYDAPTMLVVRDMAGTVFGGFASRPWQLDGLYHGTGECFLWRALPNHITQIYPWSRRNDYFMVALRAKRDSYLAMGGGEGRHALWLHESLALGHSSPTLTFRNDVLASSSDFEIALVEVWGLDVSERQRSSTPAYSFHN